MNQEPTFSNNRPSKDSATRDSAPKDSGAENSLLAIEQAQRETPICIVCGAPTIPVARGDEVWLRCSEEQRKSSILRRLTSLEFVGGHTRRLVVKANRVSAA